MEGIQDKLTEENKELNPKEMEENIRSSLSNFKKAIGGCLVSLGVCAASSYIDHESIQTIVGVASAVGTTAFFYASDYFYREAASLEGELKGHNANQQNSYALGMNPN